MCEFSLRHRDGKYVAMHPNTMRCNQMKSKAMQRYIISNPQDIFNSVLYCFHSIITGTAVIIVVLVTMLIVEEL